MELEKIKKEAATKLVAILSKPDDAVLPETALEHVDNMFVMGLLREDMPNVGAIYAACYAYKDIRRQATVGTSAEEDKQDLDDFDWGSPDAPYGDSAKQEKDTQPPDYNQFVKDRVKEAQEKRAMENKEIPNFFGKYTGNPNSKESCVVVYPMPSGGVVYNGVKYSVTMREGGTAEQALDMLREWDRFWELGKPYGIEPANEATSRQQEGDPEIELRPAPSNTRPPQQGSVTGNEDADNARTRDIVAIQRDRRQYKDTSKKAGQWYVCYIPYYKNEDGKPESIGVFYPWNKKPWDQLHKIVSKEVLESAAGDFPITLPDNQRFTLSYTINPQGFSDFQSLEPFRAV